MIFISPSTTRTPSTLLNAKSTQFNVSSILLTGWGEFANSRSCFMTCPSPNEMHGIGNRKDTTSLFWVHTNKFHFSSNPHFTLFLLLTLKTKYCMWFTILPLLKEQNTATNFLLDNLWITTFSTVWDKSHVCWRTEGTCNCLHPSCASVQEPSALCAHPLVTCSVLCVIMKQEWRTGEREKKREIERERERERVRQHTQARDVHSTVANRPMWRMPLLSLSALKSISAPRVTQHRRTITNAVVLEELGGGGILKSVERCSVELAGHIKWDRCLTWPCLADKTFYATLLAAHAKHFTPEVMTVTEQVLFYSPNYHNWTDSFCFCPYWTKSAPFVLC